MKKIIIYLFLFFSACGIEKSLHISVMKLPLYCSPEITDNYVDLEKDWASLNSALMTKLEARKFQTRLEKIKVNIIEARNSYHFSNTPKHPDLNIIGIDPNNFISMTKQYEKKLGQHKNHMNNIDTKCINKLFEEIDIIDKKINDYFK